MRTQLFFMVIMLVFLNADQLVMSPNIGSIREEFGITDADIGLVASTFTILGAVVSLLWGYLADRFRRKDLLVFSILVGEIPAFMSAFSKSFEELFFWRTLTGIGVGASFPVAHSLIGDMFEREKRSRASAYLSVSVTFGAMLGMVAGGYFGGLYGWRFPFVIVSTPNFFLAILAYFILEEPKRGEKEEELADLISSGYEYKRTPRISDYAKLFRIRTNLFLLVQGIAGTIPWGAIPYYLVEFLKREKGLDPFTSTNVFLSFGIGSIVGTLMGGWMGERLYSWRMRSVPLFMAITTGLGVFAAVAVLRYPPSNGGVFALALFGALTAVLVSMTGPNVKMILLNVNDPVDRGRIFSVFNLTDSLGTGMGKYFAGALSTSLGSLGSALEISSYFWFVCSAFLAMTFWTVEKDVENLSKILKRHAQTVEK